ncbi:hypothetical protein HNQ94_002861 [Salirhabdus euzebyi]|uniref:DUF2508 family protein n=1 Tax=Salirhabdus euzebyi TaxID=394506 RepID=A0A841Q750_9BACI|nr:YaaL family protein [Salirhabdus euzebyi]MBB6454379.1 hypothetical protein [Salirhabdus euzebyi]
MFGRKKIKKKDLDEELLMKIHLFRKEWNNLNDILENSIEPSEKGLFDQAVSRAKYFFLLKEARNRHIKGMH